MHIRQAIVALALAATAGITAAHADTVFTVTAEYDPFITGNTTITVENDTASALANVDLSSQGVTKVLGPIAANGSATYTFDDLLGGPFIQDPGDKGLPDTTSYQVSAAYLGATLTTAAFSPVSNLTGHYVDFLGACFNFPSGGCSVDPTVNYDLSGTVAEASTPVPLPPSLAFLASGLLCFAGSVARRRSVAHRR